MSQSVSRLPDANGLDLHGKVVIVTGGSRGIGSSIAQRFLDHGAQVVVCGRHAPTTVAECDGRRATFFEANVRDVGQIQRLMARTLELHGSVDILVNNAGGSPPVEAASASPRFSSAIIELNLVAPLLCAQAANVIMQKQATGGVIINIASVSGTRASPGTAAYGAAKAGLLNLTRSLAVEWAPKVRVVAVTPGLIRTEQSHLHYGDDQGLADVASTIPLARLGEGDDVACACVFLASPMAAYISGAELRVDGGGERPAFLGVVGRERAP